MQVNRCRYACEGMHICVTMKCTTAREVLNQVLRAGILDNASSSRTYMRIFHEFPLLL